MSQEIELSIVYITMNRKNQLSESLMSCISSDIDKEKTEFIIVDNGSSDGSKECIEELLERERVKFKYEQEDTNLGIGAGRNRGIELAQGDYLYIIDDDAVIDPTCHHNFFRTAISVFEDNDIIGGLTTNVYDECLECWRESRRSHLYTQKTPWIYMLHGNSHFIRKGIRNAEYCPTIIYGYEDLYMSLRILDDGKRNAVVETINTIHKPLASKWKEGSKELDDVKVKGVAGLLTVKYLLYPPIYRPLIFTCAIMRYLKYFGLELKNLKPISALFKKQTHKIVVQKIRCSTIHSIIKEYGFWTAF